MKILQKISTAFIVAITLLAAVRAGATILWDGDPATHTPSGAFSSLNIENNPGIIDVVTDPVYGPVFRFICFDPTNNIKTRTEGSHMKNFQPVAGGTYYFGWRHKWGPLPTKCGKWQVLEQIHLAGTGATGGPVPYGLHVDGCDANMHFQYQDASGTPHDFLVLPFPLNSWHSFVYYERWSESETDGFVEFWYDGAHQTLANGTFRYPSSWCFPNSTSYWKWGVYRSGSAGMIGTAYAYLWRPRAGTTFADVDPVGGGDFSIAGAPASQPVQPSLNTNYTVTVSSLSGFTGTVNLTATGLPPGGLVLFTPSSITNTGSATMTVGTSLSTPFGAYTLSIIGTSGSLAHTNTVKLVVSGFTVTATPAVLSVNAGASNSFAVAITTNTSFTGTVALGIGGVPSTAGAGFSPATLNQSGASTLTIATSTNTAAGNYPLTIYATNGSQVLTAVVTLTVNGIQAAPGPLFWSGASGIDANWSTALNWTNPPAAGNGPPGISNNVIFGNAGAGPTNFVNADTTVNALWYQLLPGSGATVSQATVINSNITLTVQGATNLTGSSFISGNYSLLVGTNNSANGGGSVAAVAISGANGTLTLNDPTGIFAVAQFNSTGNHPSSASTRAVLNLSGLGNFSANVGQLEIGCMNNGAAGTLYLAENNAITLNFTNSTYTTTAGQGLDVGFNNSNAGDPSYLFLGANNSLYVNNAIIAACKGLSALVAFNPAFTNQDPTAFIRNLNGVDPVAYWNIGDLLTSTSGANVETPQGTNDFTGGSIDLSVNALTVAKTSSGMSSPPGVLPANGAVSSNRLVVGVLTLNAGTIAVNNFTNGWQVPNMAPFSSDTAIGTVNVNGNGTLVVTNNFVLAAGIANYYVSGNPTNVGYTFVTNGYYGPTVNATNAFAQGTLNINGGTVEAVNLRGGGGISTVRLNRGTLDLQPDWALAAGTILNVSTLSVGTAGANGPALLTDAAQISTTNSLVIGTNGTFAGNTIIGSPGLTVNGTVSPGHDGAGAMTNSGVITLGAGGGYVVTMDDAIAGPVNGWSFLQAGGTLDIQSTSGNPFMIAIKTVDGPAANFDPHTNYDWVIATANGGIANFVTNRFVINSALFQNDLGGGSFFLHTSGNALVLSFTNALAPAPVTMTVASAGTSFIVSGANGVAYAPYYVLASTNLSLAPAQWTVISTNYFDSIGNFDFTNPVDPALPPTFYLLKLQ